MTEETVIIIVLSIMLIVVVLIQQWETVRWKELLDESLALNDEVIRRNKILRLLLAYERISRSKHQHCESCDNCMDEGITTP